ncbi:MAG TPA: DUF418 domain-containing protein [Phnomibacter sp.]|nr:DUF418 domain-containing protein [Phnomibacter sp.]
MNPPPNPSSSGELSTPPTHSNSPINALDVLRGKALIGGLLVSIWVFGGFSTNWQKHLFLFPHGGNYKLFAAVSLFLQGKMQAMIALVFGAGLLLFAWRQNAKPSTPAMPDLYMRRLLWLMAFGLLNGLLFLWPYDLLFHLGVVGILLFPFMRLQPKGLLVAAIVCLIIFCGKQYWNYADDKKTYTKYQAVMVIAKKIEKDSLAQRAKDSTRIVQAGKPFVAKDYRLIDSTNKNFKKDTLTKKQAGEKDAWEGLVKSMKYDEKQDADKKKAMRKSGFGDLYNYILPGLQEREARYTYTIGVWELGMMILLGMALLKLGFFEGKCTKSTYWILAIAGIGIGLLLGYYRLYLQNVSLVNYEKYITHYWIPYNQFIPIERMIMALGYAAAVVLAVRSSLFSKLLSAAADTGRMALTNYLVQSIFLTLFFTGIGMTNYGKLQQWQLYLVVLEVAVVQVVYSVIWLRHYQHGPAEWLWRSAIHWKWQPWHKNRKAGDENTIANPDPSTSIY